MSLMQRSERRLTVYDVAATLKSQFFLVTGSHTCDGCPIIFLLDSITPEPSIDEQRDALIYLTCLPKHARPHCRSGLVSDKDLQYCFVIDRRHSSYNCVKKCISLIVDIYQKRVKEVVILQPTSFFQRKFNSDPSTKFSSAFPDIKIEILDDESSLIKLFGKEHICTQLGGSVNGNPDVFIQQRMSIDSLETNCLDLEERVKELILCDSQTDLEIPNDVASTEALLNEHKATKDLLTEEISGVKNQGEVSLQCLQQEEENLLPLVQQMLHIQQVQKLCARLEDLHTAITEFWEKEENKLREFMEMREFHEQFKLLQGNMNKLVNNLNTVPDHFENSEKASRSHRNLEIIEKESEKMLAHALELAMNWKEKLSSVDEMTLNTIQPKCDELIRLHTLSINTLKDKISSSDKQSQFYLHLEQAEKWIEDGLLSSIVDDASDISDPSVALHEIECHLTVGSYLELNKYEEFMDMYRSSLSAKHQNKCEEVHMKLLDVGKIYEFKRDSLNKQLNRNEDSKKKKGLLKQLVSGKKKHQSGDSKKYPAEFTPPHISPESVTQHKEKTSQSSSLTKLKIAPGVQTDEHITPSSVATPNSLSSNHSQTNGTYDKHRSPTTSNDTTSQTSSYRADEGAMDNSMYSNLSINDQDDTISSTSHLTDSQKDYDDISRNDSLLSESYDHHADGLRHSPQDVKTTLKLKSNNRKSIKGMFVKSSKKKKDPSDKLIKETPSLFDKHLTLQEEKGLSQMRSVLISRLISDEEHYLRQLSEISQIYMLPISQGLDDVPTVLFSNQRILFGNLEEIKQFHENQFINDLKENKTTPTLIGQLFLRKVSHLRKYKDYFDTRSRAEVLLRSIEREPFLKQQQSKTTSQEPLKSCLLDPARHIVKYQEGLNSILECVRDDAEAQQEIKEAIQTLSSIFTSAQNVLHQAHIDGYHISEDTHGCLLRQSSVNYSQEKKTHKMNDLKGKLKPRHCFLYEKVIVVCKTSEEHSKFTKFTYKQIFKLEDCSPEVHGDLLYIKSPTECCLLQSSQAQQYYDDIFFAKKNAEQSLPPTPSHDMSSIDAYTRQGSVDIMKLNEIDEEEERLQEDPDVDLFNSDNDEPYDTHTESLSPEVNNGDRPEYMLMDDYDNDLLLSKGDIVELVEQRKDMMKVQIPGTGITDWFPKNILMPYS